MSLRIAVLASGRGSNLGALVAACNDGRIAGGIVGVFSDKPDCAAVGLANAAGIPVRALRPDRFDAREAFDTVLFGAIAAVQPDLIVCAGYMRVISAGAVGAWLGRMINIHPSLLPAYPGLRTHARALADRAREHGASVHFVTADLDAGPVITQARIPIEPSDSPEGLAARLLPTEHRLLVATIRLFAARRVELVNRSILLDGRPLPRPLELTADGDLS
jgi:phosphoribosylglycinamide formyltransferase-1